MIVRRPGVGLREILEEGQIDLRGGLIGDRWKLRTTTRFGQKSRSGERQVTIMNARVAQLVARVRERWPLAGDQLYLDLDLSKDNLPVGACLAIGSAVVEITSPPHTACKKFEGRFGSDAAQFLNTRQGRRLNLRGVNARVVESGLIHVGDVASKIVAESIT